MALTKAMNREEIADRMSDSMSQAKLVGWNDTGEMCVWFGGYSFTVYDATDGWKEVRHFTNGSISGLQEKDSEEGRGYAKDQMESEGFKVVE